MSSVTAFGPGRVNLIGEHTDYNDGLCLPFAIERGVTVVATPLDGGRIEAHAADQAEDDTFAVDAPREGEAGGWRAFVRGAVGELAASGVAVRGARLQIDGDVPQGGGLSSSAALEAALCLALLAIAEAPEPADRRELARLCSRIENDWVGAQTGLLDQMASLFGTEGHAFRLDCRDLAIEPVPLDLQGWTLAVVDSGEAHSHAESGYNDRRRECAEACEALGVVVPARRFPARRRAAARAAGSPPAPRFDRERPGRRRRRRTARGRPAGARRAARRFPRLAARRLRGLGAGRRGDRGAAEGRPAPRARGSSAAASAGPCSRCSPRTSSRRATPWRSRRGRRPLCADCRSDCHGRVPVLRRNTRW